MCCISTHTPLAGRDVRTMIAASRTKKTTFLPIHSIFANEGVDSLAGFVGSILQGATDTTFYVIALYFGSVGIRKIGNSLLIGIIADIAGITAAFLLGLHFFAPV